MIAIASQRLSDYSPCCEPGRSISGGFFGVISCNSWGRNQGSSTYSADLVTHSRREPKSRQPVHQSEDHSHERLELVHLSGRREPEDEVEDVLGLVGESPLGVHVVRVVHLQPICTQCAPNMHSICAECALNMRLVYANNMQTVCTRYALNLQSICNQ